MPPLLAILAIVGTLGLIGLAVGFALFAAIFLAPLAIIGWLCLRGNPLDPAAKVPLLGATILVAVVFYAIVNVWLGLSAAGVFGVALATWYVNHPWPAAKQKYDGALARYRTFVRCPPDMFRRLAEKLEAEDGTDLSIPFFQYMLDIMEAIYREDYQEAVFPAFPPFDIQYHKLRLALVDEEIQSVMAHGQHEAARASATINLVKEVLEVPFEFSCAVFDRSPLWVCLYDAVPDIRRMVTDVVGLMFQSKYTDIGVGETLRDTYLANAVNASSKYRSRDEIERLGDLFPPQHPGTPRDIVEDYFTGTRFIDAFAQGMPLPLSHHLRCEHTVVVAGTGGGKSQFLESMILSDLDEDDPPGMVIIDSKAGHDDLLQRVARLDVFHPQHGRLRDRLVIIDPRDGPALNMFDVGADRIKDKINDVVASLRYFIGSLLGNELSSQMNVLFLPLLHIVLRIPGATLHTFANIVDDPLQHRDIIDQLPEGPRTFLLQHYDKPPFRVTKTSIVTRIFEIVNESDFDQMFNAPRNAIDLAAALNDGKIILVSTERSYLHHLSPIFGRYIISRVISAALERANIPKADRRPAYLYIDECAPYVDEKTEELLTTMRSYGLGAVLAFQDVRQMGAYTHAIQGNTAIKLMGEVTDADARAFATDMRTTPDFIMSQRRESGPRPAFGSFACFTRDLAHAIGVRVPFGMLNERLMSDEDYDLVRELNRRKVREPCPSGVSNGSKLTGDRTAIEAQHPDAPQPADSSSIPSTKPGDDTAASTEW